MKLGEMIVDDFGICQVVNVDDDGSFTVRYILSKEIFIEAYERWINSQEDKE